MESGFGRLERPLDGGGVAISRHLGGEFEVHAVFTDPGNRLCLADVEPGQEELGQSPNRECEHQGADTDGSSQRRLREHMRTKNNYGRRTTILERCLGGFLAHPIMRATVPRLRSAQHR